VALEFFHNARLELTGFELSGIKISSSSYSSLTAPRHRRHMYFLLANISRLLYLLSRMQTPLSSGFSSSNPLMIRWPSGEHNTEIAYLGLSRDITGARVTPASELGGCRGVDMDIMTNIFGSKADKKLNALEAAWSPWLFKT
jgi:hypothetical protein